MLESIRSRARGTDTTVARFELARANEAQVLAESSLEGERRVAVVRLAMLLMMGLSQRGVGRMTDELLPWDSARRIAIGLYLAFSVGALLLLTLQKARPARARWMPIPTTLADVGFPSFMAWHTWHETGHFEPGMHAASLAVVLVFSVARYSWLHVVLSTALSSAAYLGLSYVTGHASLMHGSFVLACFMGMGLLLGMTNSAVGDMFLSLRRRDNLSRFLPKQVVERVMKLGDASLQPVQREVTILFSDIRDFTSLSESLPPRQVLELLDEYFSHMTHIVLAHDGIVNKFLGDGMLACWGVPDHHADHAEKAMRAALDMRAKLEELNAHRVQHGLVPLRIGIGLHTGTVAAGMLGGAEQHEYTVIGDAVNLASRVEGLTKAHGVDILVSESTWRHGGARFEARHLGEAQVKGRREAVVVYALQGRTVGARTVLAGDASGTGT